MSQTSEKVVLSQPLESEPNQSRSTWYEKTIYTLFALAFLEQVALDTLVYNQREKADINLQREHAESLTVNPDEIFEGVKKGSLTVYFSNTDQDVFLLKKGFPELVPGIYCSVFLNQIKAIDIDGDSHTIHGARVAFNTSKHCINGSNEMTFFNSDGSVFVYGKIVKNVSLNDHVSDPSVLTIVEFNHADQLYAFVNAVQNVGTHLLEQEGTLQFCHTPRSTGFNEMCEEVEVVGKENGNLIINTTVTAGDSGASVIKVTESKKEVVCTIRGPHNAYVSDNLAVCSRIDQDLDYYAISQLLLATYNDPLYWEFNLYDN